MWNRQMRCVVVTAVGIAALWCAELPCCAQVDQELLQMLKAGSAQAVASVRSGSGKLSLHKTESKNGVVVMEINASYTIAFSGSRFRMEAETTYLKNEGTPSSGGGIRAPKPGQRQRETVVFDGNRVTRFYPDSGLATVGDANSTVGKLATGRFAQLVPRNYRSMDLNTLCSSVGGEPTVVRRERISEEDCVVVEFTSQKNLSNGTSVQRTYQVRFSLDKDLTVPMFRVLTDGGTEGGSILLTQILVNANGSGDNWRPASVAVDEYRPDANTDRYSKTSSSEITYNPDFGINVPVSESEFSLSLPSGTTVVDEVLDLHYVIP